MSRVLLSFKLAFTAPGMKTFFICLFFVSLHVISLSDLVLGQPSILIYSDLNSKLIEQTTH